MDLVVVGPVNSLGYGVVCANIVYELSKHMEVGLNVIGGEIQPDDLSAFEPYVQRSVYRAREIWRDSTHRKHLPHLHIWHEWELGGEWTGPTIGMPFFETIPLLDHAIDPLSACDLVVVPSQWAKEVINRYAPKANVVYTKYAGYDPLIYHPNTHAPRRPGLIHAGKLEIRKGIDLVIKAFSMIYQDHPDLSVLLDR